MKRLALIALAGCATTSKPVVLQPLGDTVALTEVTSDGERIELGGGGVADVDLNSRIEVRVDRARVAEIVLGEQLPNGPEVERVKARLRDLTELTRKQQQALAMLVKNTDAWARDGGPRIPSESLQNANKRFEAALIPLNEAIGRYAVRAGQQRSAYFAGPGTQGVFDALRAEQTQVLSEAAALASSSGLRWRMQAVFANNKPIHLDNYDTYPDGPFAVVDKLQPQVTAKELSAQFEEAKQLARELKMIAGLKDALVHAALGALQGYLASLQEAVREDFAALEPVIRAIPAQALDIKEVAAVKTQLEALSATLREIKPACTPVLDAIKRKAPGDVSLDAAEACIRAVIQHGPALLAQARTTGAAAVALVDYVAKNRAKLGELLQPLTDLLPKLETVKRVQQWGDVVKDGWAQLKGFLDAGTAATAAATWSDDQQTDHVLAEITDTTIDLRRTERKEAALLHFRPSIINKDGSAAIVGATHDLRVVRMGAYIDVSAGVAFVDANDDESGPFSAAPGVVAALHYRARPSNGAARAFNALRPGIGLHFLYPDLGSKEVNDAGAVTGEDPSFELGVGGTLTLFGDLLQVGVGYDLQVQRSYWYLGFGLDTLAKLGVRFSPGS
ncbi:MAG: hypothetical protein H7138_25420 [Myxococcales bacterium]|nr:hypothetical protein [Myxococcales bacterium]